MLNDVSAVDCGVTLLGHRHAAPVPVAPSSNQMLAHPEGEIATVRGASLTGTTTVLSSAANTEPAVAQAVAGRVPVLVDGDIRRGADVAKALALGANAVLIGRPVIYGLAAGGAEGVAHVLRIRRMELLSTMALCGVSKVEELGPELIWRRSP